MPQDERLVAAWSDVARGYLEHWVPRFAPFVAEAVDALVEALPGPRAAPRARPRAPVLAPVLVPGCGPGREVDALARRLAPRPVVGMDPAPDMLALARAAARPNVTLVRAAADEAARHAGRTGAAGLLSTFTLQLLERPQDALADWARALAPGAPAVALFWPRQPDGAAWARLRAAIEAEAGAWRPAWEPEVRAALPALGWSLELERDVVHPIAHASAEEAWDLLVSAGSLQPLARRLPPDALARCRARWLAAPGLAPHGAGVAHRPTARLWRLRRGR